MMEWPFSIMKSDMDACPFVVWDRFVRNKDEKTLNLYGWIAREDSHEDFVLLEYYLKNGLWHLRFTTSSAEHHRQLGKLLECTGPELVCERVEKFFPTTNCIKLKNDSEGA